MAGRRPKPTVVKVLAGNPGGRPLAPEPEMGAVKSWEPPEKMAADGKALWKRLVEAMPDGLLRETDLPLLEQLCDTWALYRMARRKLATLDPVSITEKGYEYESPWLQIQRKALADFRHLAVEFGLSPSSRARVGGSVKKGKEDEASNYFGYGAKGA